jgi:hypothetical protein
MFAVILGIFVLIIVVVAVYTVVGVVYSATGVDDAAPKPVSLDKVSQLLDSETANKKLLSKGGSTLAGFFHVRFGNRTTAGSGQNFVQLVGIDGAFSFRISPTATQLYVKTHNPEEAPIDLPPFPQQTWVFLAILRDGRRFDVLYNDKIVASHRLDQYPVSVANPLKTGAVGLLGEAVHVLVNDRRLSPKEVAGLRASLADTNGAPPQESTFPMPNLFALTLKNLQVACIPGLPCNPVTAPPTNRLKTWSSLYN